MAAGRRPLDDEAVDHAVGLALEHHRQRDGGDDGHRRIDLGSNERAVLEARTTEERRAENLRLAYVALTRAESALYLVWGRNLRVKDSDLSLSA